MSVAENVQGKHPAEKREDFLLESFRHLEGKLQGIRRRVMREAANIARSEARASEDVFEVTTDHVNRALAELLNHPAECKKAAGLAESE